MTVVAYARGLLVTVGYNRFFSHRAGDVGRQVGVLHAPAFA